MRHTTTRKRSFGLATWQSAARPDIQNMWQTTSCKRSSGLARRQVTFKQLFETKVDERPLGVAHSQGPQEEGWRTALGGGSQSVSAAWRLLSTNTNKHRRSAAAKLQTTVSPEEFADICFSCQAQLIARVTEQSAGVSAEKITRVAPSTISTVWLFSARMHPIHVLDEDDALVLGGFLHQQPLQWGLRAPRPSWSAKFLLWITSIRGT